MFVNALTVSACLLAGLGALASAAASAQNVAPAGIQSLDAVRRAAESALRAQLQSASGLELEAGALDPRMRLPACATKLESRAPLPRGSQSRAIVRVACTAGAPWALNVPVDIRRRADVLVLRRAATRGEELKAADVSVESRLLPGLASPYLADVTELKGRLTRRPLPAGTAVTADALAAALLIQRGQKVTLAATMGGIEVRAPGVALADAAAHQRVRVQNLNSSKIIEGVADSEGVVRVRP
jgi:flagella basal body P-ring formation protein FlgA